jgi:hypothetical protein
MIVHPQMNLGMNLEINLGIHVAFRSHPYKMRVFDF